MQSFVAFAPERVIMRAWEQEMGEAEPSSNCCRGTKTRRSRVLRREPGELGERTVGEGQGPAYMGEPCYPALSCAMMESLADYRGSTALTRIVDYLQTIVESSEREDCTATEWYHKVMTLVNVIRQETAVDFFWLSQPVEGDTGEPLFYSRRAVAQYCWDSMQQASEYGRCSGCTGRRGESCIVGTWMDSEYWEGEEVISLLDPRSFFSVWSAIATFVMLTAIGSHWDNDISVYLCMKMIERGEMYFRDHVFVDEEERGSEWMEGPPPPYMP